MVRTRTIVKTPPNTISKKYVNDTDGRDVVSSSEEIV
jgi:hypothetical protein